MAKKYFCRLLPWGIIKCSLRLLMIVLVLSLSETSFAAINDNSMSDKKAGFVSKMESLREAILAGPNENVIKFKVLVEEEIDNTINSFEASFRGSDKSEYIYEMMKIKKQIYDDHKLNISQAKKRLAIDIGEVTEKYKEKIIMDKSENAVKTYADRMEPRLITNRQDDKIVNVSGLSDKKHIENIKNEKNIDIVNKNEKSVSANEKTKAIYELINKAISEIDNLPNNNVVKFKVQVNSDAEVILESIKDIKYENVTELANKVALMRNDIYADRKLEIISAKIKMKQIYIELKDELVKPINKSIDHNEKIVQTTKPKTELLELSTRENHENNGGGADAKPASSIFSEKVESMINEIKSVPNNNIIKFKVTVENQTEMFLADVKPLFKSETMSALDKEMNEIKNKIYNSKKLKIETAKNEIFSDYRKIESKYGPSATANSTISQSSYFSKPSMVATSPIANNAPVSSSPSSGASPRQSARTNPSGNNVSTTGTDAQGNYLPAATAPKRVVKPVTTEVYSDLLKQVMNVNEQQQNTGKKVRISGGIRFHYAVNSGNGSWAKNSAGLRADIAAETQLDKDWRLFAGLSAKKSFLNYDDKVDYRLYLMKKIGTSNFRIGSFGYFMADGNIYDDSFDGMRFDFGETIRYTVSYGNTKYSKDTLVATARYDDYDYSLEAGAYLFKNNDDNVQSKILTMGGVYKFSNFNLGAMALVANRKDSNGKNFGYVYSFNYGELKPWRKGTYNIWAKYYYQPRYTYIAPSMNGRGGWMQGFRGVGMGINYTFSENLVGSLEYYSLTDMTTGAPGNTWWGSLTHFF